MTLKISSQNGSECTLVRVEGRLEGSGVGDLEGVCLGAKGPLRLELSALLRVDDVGLGLLRSLIASGATVSGASPYVSFLLECDAHDGP